MNHQYNICNYMFFKFKSNATTGFPVRINDQFLIQKIKFSAPVNFIIHGWRDGIEGHNKYDRNDTRKHDLWMIPMGKDWAKYNNSNVCLVDWSFLAKGDYLFTIKYQLQRVANEMVKFTEVLRVYGMNYTQVSVAGHSLGAHIAGLFGRGVQSKGWKINAIYGM